MRKSARTFFTVTGHPRELRPADVPPRLRALVLGPHPDDFDEIAVTLRRRGGAHRMTAEKAPER